ncbi:GPW/gp25 family protein [Antarcticirhabdus aurantiaca]|uniref:GPW/gp25 family protein n=1 Tax=Antarcticirhabdus aurantiaca TaxID=2606717 RepID=UPI00131A8C27|nr:GPW/gp25 family protein [Antarcticirhabdus aurantiaca]
MPASAGVDGATGKPLTDWGHVAQSIRIILLTPIGSRVMRREFGSELPLLIDRPMIAPVILAVRAAVANALARWEPRFRLTGVEVNGDASGLLSLTVIGRYLPRGHRGDASPASDEARSVVISTRRTA